MSPRHNNKERAGLHFIAHTIEEEFGWVFREQSIADVGIDALVEQCEEGDPTGSFLALQIKSGEGNVDEKEDTYTYYISNTHYYYWTTLELPIILTCYIKKKNKKKIYWVELIKSNISKTRTRWKIEIPKNQFLDINSIEDFEKILLKNKRKPIGSKGEDSKLVNLGRFAAIDQVSISLNFLNKIITILGQQVRKLSSQTTEATSKEDFEFKLRIFKIQCEIQYVLSSYATRTLTEINIYSQLFSDMLIGYRTKNSIIEPFATVEMLNTMDDETSQLRNLKNSFSKLIEEVELMNKSIIGLRDSNVLKDKRNLKLAILASEQIIEEIRISNILIEQIIE